MNLNQMETVNPATGELIHRYDIMQPQQVVSVIEYGYAAYQQWRALSYAERAKPVVLIAELLQKRKREYATLITTEMGKPITQAMAEIEKCANMCVHFAENAEKYLAGREVKTDAKKSYVTHEPIGIVFGIMPWNFPFWQVFRFAIPALLAGNTAILKHAPISTGCALAIEKLFNDARFPLHVFQTVIVNTETAAEIMAHTHVAAVTFTGSVAAGRIIAAEAGKALKKTVLELGGSDPYVVLADADVDLAAEACVTSRLLNAGQSCIAAKRLIVVNEIYDVFVKKIQEKMQRFKFGDPLQDATTLGPLSRKDIRDNVHTQVLKTTEAGATLLTGGVVPDAPGFYYPVTLLTNIPENSPAYQQEIFGPVLAVIRAQDEADALRIANNTSFGLGAAVFTKDVARGEKIAAKILQAGTCVVNTFVASDSRLPFGGIKNSGYGRELAEEGILSFVNTKTVMVK